MSSPFIEASASALARALFDTSWQVAALVVLVLCVQRLFKRQLSARWSYGLWLVVVLRLALLPVAPLEFAPHANPLLWRPELSDTSPRDAAKDTRAPSAALSLARPRVRTSDHVKKQVRKGAAPTEGLRASPGRLFEPPTSAVLAQPQDRGETAWTSYLLGIWLAGVGLALLRLVFREIRFRRRWAHLPTLEEPRLDAALERARALAGVGRLPRLVEADFLSGPAVAGLQAPVLLVPPAFGEDLDDDALGLVLLHELFHLRHRDVHANVLFAVVRVAFWFHPLAHLALNRLFAERESLRDWEALAASQSTEPRMLAETLLGFVRAGAHTSTPLTSPLFLPSLRRNPDLEKRLVMITRFTPRTHRSWALGSLLCLSLSWLGFTGTAPASPQASPTVPSMRGGSPRTPSLLSATGSESPRLSVQHATREAEWHRDLRERLGEHVSGQLSSPNFAAGLHELAEELGINIALALPPSESYDAPIDLEYRATAESVLDYLLDMVDPDLSWCLHSRTVIVGYQDNLPADTELVMYSATPIVDLGIDMDDLIRVTLDLTSDREDDWGRAGYSIDEYEGRLFVRADYRRQAKIESLLQRLLRFDPVREADAARGAFMEMDTILLDVNFARRPLSDVLGELAEGSRFELGCDDSLLDEADLVDLHVKQASLLDALSLISLQLNAPLVELEHGAWLGEGRQGDTTNRIYLAGEIFARFDDEEGANDMLVSLIQESTGGDFWDTNPKGLVFPLGPYLVVQATPSIHAEVEALLGAFARL